MAKKTQIAQYNFSQGEVSSYVEARPDVAKRYNGARTFENFWAFPEGGAFRRPGTIYIAEVPDSSKFTLAVPFEFSISDNFIVEFSNLKFRFIKNRALLGAPYELASPYVEADLRDIHYEQSNDFLFLTSLNAALDVQKLARVTDTNWSVANFNADPPPSFDADEDLAVPGAAGANTGDGIKFRVGTDQFLAGDVGRQIVAGVGRAVITSITGTGDGPRQVTVNVLDAFTQTIAAGPANLTSVGTLVTSVAHGAVAGNAVILTGGAQSGEIRMIVAPVAADTFTIDAAFSVDQGVGVAWNKISAFAASGWLLHLAPQVTMDVDKKEPIGTTVALLAGAASLRSSYVGKFIKILGGAIKITAVATTTTGTGVIKSVLSDATTANPAAVAAGAWRLQEASWSSTRGRPRTVRTHGGRLDFGGTIAQPNTLWGSSLDDIYNFATGSLATDAYEYTFRTGSQNAIQWLLSLTSLYIGDAKTEYFARGQGVDRPIGGDEIPYTAKVAENGSMHVQPIVVDNAILMLHHFGRSVIALSYSIDSSPDASSFAPQEVTVFARQIADMGFAVHRPVYVRTPNSIIFFPLNNGQLAGLTFKPRQEIQAWARTKTRAGDSIESIAANHEDGQTRQVIYQIAKRTINGATKRYWEYYEDNSAVVSSRGWGSLQTDCAKVGTILSGATTITGLSHLATETVDVILGSSFIGQKTVSAGGVVTLDASESPTADTVYEVGLHYDSTLTTLRPNIPNETTEGFKRSWPIAMVRLENTIGGKLNGKPLKKQEGGARMFTGLAKMENLETDDPYDGALTITQDQPYPMTVLGVCGKITYGDDIG